MKSIDMICFKILERNVDLLNSICEKQQNLVQIRFLFILRIWI